MATRKRSRERRGSKKSTRSSLGSDVDTSKIDISNAAAEKKLQTILEEEEQELIIYSVREELMQRVMEECYKKYLEKQSVKFTVHCAYRALVQLVNLGLFHHDPGKPFYQGHPSWLPDKPPKPSPPDTWAASQVAIKRKPIPQPLAALPCDDKSEVVEEKQELENVFTGIEISQEETASEPETVEMFYESEDVGEAVEFESEVQLDGPPATEVSFSGEEELTIPERFISRPLSIFTQTTRMPKEYLPHSMQSARSKIKGMVTKTTEPPELSLDEVSSQKSKLSVSILPPLRSDAKYKAAAKIPSKEPSKEENVVKPSASSESPDKSAI